jgi:hypothetical protein
MEIPTPLSQTEILDKIAALKLTLTDDLFHNSAVHQEIMTYKKLLEPAMQHSLELAEQDEECLSCGS